MTRIVLAAALVAPLTASLHAQSLADAARKAEEQRAKAKQAQTKTADTKDAQNTEKPATKVYTNDDLVAAPAALSATADSEKKSADADKKSSAATGSSGDSSSAREDAASWRARMTWLRAQVDRDELDCRTKQKAVTTLVSMMNAAGGLVSEGGRLVGAGLGRARADQQECEARVEADKKRIADAEEEARVRGVPPGWLR